MVSLLATSIALSLSYHGVSFVYGADSDSKESKSTRRGPVVRRLIKGDASASDDDAQAPKILPVRVATLPDRRPEQCWNKFLTYSRLCKNNLWHHHDTRHGKSPLGINNIIYDFAAVANSFGPHALRLGYHYAVAKRNATAVSNHTGPGPGSNGSDSPTTQAGANINLGWSPDFNFTRTVESCCQFRVKPPFHFNSAQVRPDVQEEIERLLAQSSSRPAGSKDSEASDSSSGSTSAPQVDSQSWHATTNAKSSDFKAKPLRAYELSDHEKLIILRRAIADHITETRAVLTSTGASGDESPIATDLNCMPRYRTAEDSSESDSESEKVTTSIEQDIVSIDSVMAPAWSWVGSQLRSILNGNHDMQYALISLASQPLHELRIYVENLISELVDHELVRARGESLSTADHNYQNFSSHYKWVMGGFYHVSAFNTNGLKVALTPERSKHAILEPLADELQAAAKYSLDFRQCPLGAAAVLLLGASFHRWSHHLHFFNRLAGLSEELVSFVISSVRDQTGHWQPSAGVGASSSAVSQSFTSTFFSNLLLSTQWGRYLPQIMMQLPDINPHFHDGAAAWGRHKDSSPVDNLFSGKDLSGDVRKLSAFFDRRSLNKQLSHSSAAVTTEQDVSSLESPTLRRIWRAALKLKGDPWDAATESKLVIATVVWGKAYSDLLMTYAEHLARIRAQVLLFCGDDMSMSSCEAASAAHLSMGCVRISTHLLWSAFAVNPQNFNLALALRDASYNWKRLKPHYARNQHITQDFQAQLSQARKESPLGTESVSILSFFLLLMGFDTLLIDFDHVLVKNPEPHIDEMLRKIQTRLDAGDSDSMTMLSPQKSKRIRSVELMVGDRELTEYVPVVEVSGTDSDGAAQGRSNLKYVRAVTSTCRAGADFIYAKSSFRTVEWMRLYVQYIHIHPTINEQHAIDGLLHYGISKSNYFYLEDAEHMRVVYREIQPEAEADSQVKAVTHSTTLEKALLNLYQGIPIESDSASTAPKNSAPKTVLRWAHTNTAEDAFPPRFLQGMMTRTWNHGDYTRTLPLPGYTVAASEDSISGRWNPFVDLVSFHRSAVNSAEKMEHFTSLMGPGTESMNDNSATFINYMDKMIPFTKSVLGRQKLNDNDPAKIRKDALAGESDASILSNVTDSLSLTPDWPSYLHSNSNSILDPGAVPSGTKLVGKAVQYQLLREPDLDCVALQDSRGFLENLPLL